MDVDYFVFTLEIYYHQVKIFRENTYIYAHNICTYIHICTTDLTWLVEFI